MCRKYYNDDKKFLLQVNKLPKMYAIIATNHNNFWRYEEL
jgi:hypothetical protein